VFKKRTLAVKTPVSGMRIKHGESGIWLFLKIPL